MLSSKGKKKEQIEVGLAMALVTGWSFGKDEDGFNAAEIQELLFQNQGLAFAVIAHATTPSNYLVK